MTITIMRNENSRENVFNCHENCHSAKIAHNRLSFIKNTLIWIETWPRPVLDSFCERRNNMAYCTGRNVKQHIRLYGVPSPMHVLSGWVRLSIQTERHQSQISCDSMQEERHNSNFEKICEPSIINYNLSKAWSKMPEGTFYYQEVKHQFAIRLSLSTPFVLVLLV